MRMVLQRVSRARVLTDGECIGRIKKGIVLLLGVGPEDTRQTADLMLEKVLRLRIFADKNGKTNLSLMDVKGELLVVSQFTLYADLRRGNRPGFTLGARPEEAKELYEYVVGRAKELLGHAEHGRFGADMEVELVNDGPFTIVLDSSRLK